MGRVLAMKILIVKLSSLGDLIHTLPAAAALRQAYPHARIDWLVEPAGRSLLELCPLVDRILVSRKGVRGTLTTVVQLRREGYDAALDFQGLWKSAVLTRLSGARFRLGFAREYLREPSAAWLYTHRVRPGSPHLHRIDANLALAEAAGAAAGNPGFPLVSRPEDDAYVQEKLEELGLKRFAVLNPAAGWPTKEWPVERYAALAKRFPAELGLDTLWTWGPGEDHFFTHLQRLAVAVRTFPTTVPQMIPLLRSATLFVGGDTGPMHLACALGTPVVAILGPTSPWHNGPFSPEDAVAFRPLPCSHCYRRKCPTETECLNISVDEILEAAARRLAFPRAPVPNGSSLKLES
ncbi:MAG: glycosyltransferase family 9 protein [Acidobacteria bacterium]|nr:glycosyltransferase family 9 protein [Acidobacteriota bacterium]